MTPEVFRFLRELRANNDREWFAESTFIAECKRMSPLVRFISRSLGWRW